VHVNVTLPGKLGVRVCNAGDLTNRGIKLPTTGANNCQLPQGWGQDAMSNPYPGCGDVQGGTCD